MSVPQWPPTYERSGTRFLTLCGSSPLVRFECSAVAPTGATTYRLTHSVAMIASAIQLEASTLSACIRSTFATS